MWRRSLGSNNWCDKFAPAAGDARELDCSFNSTEDMPQRWVVRRDVDGQAESEPLRCFVEHAILAEPGLRRVEECVAALVRDGEECTSTADKRPVTKNGVYVGFIEVTREFPLM